MNLIEFIKHPAYNYYITTLVHDCLLSDLTNVFDYNLLKYIKKPNFATNTIDYIISANIDIADEVEEQIQQLLQYDNYKALNKQFVDTEHLYVFDYNRSKIFHINIPINTLDEDIPNILEEYGLKESECNYMITEFPCKTINLTYEDKIVNKEDKIQDSKISI